MKIGLTQIVLGNTPVDDVLALCKEAGYQAIELFFSEGGDPDINLTEHEIRQLGERCAAAGIEVVSLIAWYKDRGNFLTLDEESKARARRSLTRAIEIAEILRVDTVLLHPGAMDPQASYLEVWNDFVREMQLMGDRAAKSGVTIGVENVWNKFMLSPKEARDLVDAIGHPNVGIYLDTANMMLYGYPEQWLRDLGDAIVGVHFKDFARSQFRFVDLLDGDTDWGKILAGLKAIGYQGAVLHEVGGDYAKQLELADRMRQILSA